MRLVAFCYDRFERIWSLFSALSKRERLIVGFVVVSVLLYALSIPIVEGRRSLAQTRRLLAVRRADLARVEELLPKYTKLRNRIRRVHSTLDKSQLGFADVTSRLDSIVKAGVSDANYGLKKSGQPSKLGANYEKQKFTLKINSLSLEELVKLLYELEKSENSIFLGKIDVNRGYRGKLSATFEVFSIRKL